MYLRMAWRLLVETDKRLLWKLAYNMGYKGLRSVQRFKARLKEGRVFPPFLYISIVNSCNLRCQGCWVDVAARQQAIDLEAMDRLIGEAKAEGNSFFGILGGEPFMHPQLVEMLSRHPDCYFQVFTNGHFLTDETARALRRLGNVTPLISIEGTEFVSDQRRGRSGVYSKSMQGLQTALRHKLITGVCTSLCQTNIDDLLQERWVDRLIEMGVMYLWYHVYRPVGPDPQPGLALTPAQQLAARRFVVEMRARKPIGIIDAYYDHDGRALCPAATGISHHVSPWGDVEFCPIVQFACDSIHDPRPLREKFDSEFLRDFRQTAAQATRGCIVLERPDLIQELVRRHQARDTTARRTALSELEAMQPRPSQYHAGEEVPEKSWFYRWIKRHWYHDFGAYARAAAAPGARSAPPCYTASSCDTASSCGTAARGV